MNLPDADRVLLWVAAAHGAIGAICLGALWFDAAPILGVHPALKPFKFAASISVFLATMAIVVPSLSAAEPVQRVLAWTLASTMVLEMAGIAVQALRGTTSHFNTHAALDRAIWNTMAGAIVVATLAMVAVAALATLRPMRDAAGAPLAAVSALAWRVGLWMFLLAAYTGSAMGGRGQHSVGGADGGPGLAVVNWSVRHGDLRIPHFVALHALQSLPLIAAALRWLPMPGSTRWAAMLAVIALHLGVAGWTLARALAGRQLW
jgi:hypothetical protein